MSRETPAGGAPKRSKRAKPADGSAPAPAGDPSRERLEELMSLARVYRGWTARELASHLGRDVHSVLPDSGNPKLDLVVKLAQALDWPVASVVEDLCGGPSPLASGAGRAEPDDYASANRAAYEAFRVGDYAEMIRLAARMHAFAQSGEERATAALREWGGWDGLGRHVQALEVLQRGLGEAGLSVELSTRLTGNLATTYFTLGQLTEAEGVATWILDRVARGEYQPRSAIEFTALASHVRGQSRRVRALITPSERSRWAELAARDLRAAIDGWRRFADAVSESTYEIGAEIAEGASLAAEAIAGQREVSETCEMLESRLEFATDLEAIAGSPRLECVGWWCIYGAELAAFLMKDEEARDRSLAIFSNKGYEVADRLGHWAFRERLITIDFLARRGDGPAFTSPEDRTIDSDDIRLLAGVMGRFPNFRRIGWELLRGSPNTL